MEFDLDVDCPECRYPIWVRRSELAAQVSVLCPCCRLVVRLVNPDGSAQTFENDLDRMLKEAFG